MAQAPPNTAHAGGRSSRPRAPGVTFLAIAAAMVVLISAIARATHHAPPPTIAEFAPKAVSQIKEPPPNQSSVSGENEDAQGEDAAAGDGGEGGDAGSGAGGPEESKGSSPRDAPGKDSQTSDEGPQTPRLKRCVPGPDGVLRQTEDPQSPSCVDFWDNASGNGGSTSKGVSESEIRVAVPQLENSGFQAQLARDLGAYFTARFQFYGRTLRLIPTRSDFAGNGNATQIELAAAADADQTHDVFASTDSEYNSGANYRRELANRRIISVAEQPWAPEALMATSGHPYMWSYPMDSATTLRMLGEWMCKRVAPFNANYTEDPLFAGRPRTFGIFAQEVGATKWQEPVASILKPVLSACGAQIADEFYTDQFFVNPATWQGVMSRFKVTSGVSTVICLCWSYDLAVSIGPAATNQGYFPEWLLTPYFQTLQAGVMKLIPAAQAKHMFGINTMPRDVSFAEDIAIQAVKEVNPAGYTANDSNTRQFLIDLAYKNVLLLASGIQMAGPNLTPETFEEALHAERFPNPDHPTRPGKVRFTGGVHSMIMDAAEFWWSTTAPSPYNDSGVQNGAWCYVDAGERYRIGQWPAASSPSDVKFFTEPCDSGA